MRINIGIFKKLRERSGLSIADLSAKCRGVSASTIHRIESGKTSRQSKVTIDRLARALHTDMDTLTGEKPLLDDEVREKFSYDSQMRVRLTHEQRNAFNFVAIRYHVDSAHIFALAPLLFHIFAGESLNERTIAINSVDELQAAMQLAGAQIAHISGRLTSDNTADELANLERRSITKNDIFGDVIDEDDAQWDARPHDYDHDVDNPFCQYLKRRVAAGMQASDWHAEFEYFDRQMGPRYVACRSEAEAYCAGDADLADNLINGMIGLHEIPPELKPAANFAARNDWLRTKIAQNAEEFTFLADGLLGELGI